MFLNEISAVVKMCTWSELLTDDLRKFSNFETASNVDGRLYREAFGDDTLRFASHEESYKTEGLSN
jgi:hypothetical protein